MNLCVIPITSSQWWQFGSIKASYILGAITKRPGISGGVCQGLSHFPETSQPGTKAKMLQPHRPAGIALVKALVSVSNRRVTGAAQCHSGAAWDRGEAVGLEVASPGPSTCLLYDCLPESSSL